MEQQTKHTPTWFFSKNERLKVIEVFSEDEQEFKTNIPFRVAIVTRLTDAKLIAEAPTTAAERDSLKEALESFNKQIVSLQKLVIEREGERDKLKEEKEQLIPIERVRD